MVQGKHIRLGNTRGAEGYGIASGGREGDTAQQRPGSTFGACLEEATLMKPRWIVKLIVAAGLVAGIGWYVLSTHREQSRQNELTDAYNRIVDELSNRQKHEEAYAAFEKLLPQCDGQIAEEVRKAMVDCCLAIGDAPSSSVQKAAEWYARAEELKPGSLDQERKKVVDLMAARQHGQAGPTP